jgi:AP2-associated kinase
VQALGVLLFVLCFGRLPFAGDSKLQILNGKYEMPATPSRAPQVRRQLAGRAAGLPTPDVLELARQTNLFSTCLHCSTKCGDHLC